MEIASRKKRSFWSQRWVTGAIFGLLIVPFIYLLGFLDIPFNGLLFMAYAFFVFVPLLLTSVIPLELTVQTNVPMYMPILNTTGWIVSALASMVMWAILFQLVSPAFKWAFNIGSKKK